MEITKEIFASIFLNISLTTFKAMLYTEITLPTFVHAKNGASMGQTQTASTIETTATTPRELMSEHRLTAKEAEQIEAAGHLFPGGALGGGGADASG